jgi:hypothetical protein
MAADPFLKWLRPFYDDSFFKKSYEQDWRFRSIPPCNFNLFQVK